MYLFTCGFTHSHTYIYLLIVANDEKWAFDMVSYASHNPQNIGQVCLSVLYKYAFVNNFPVGKLFFPLHCTCLKWHNKLHESHTHKRLRAFTSNKNSHIHNGCYKPIPFRFDSHFDSGPLMISSWYCQFSHDICSTALHQTTMRSTLSVLYCKIQQTLWHHSIKWIMVYLNFRFALI